MVSGSQEYRDTVLKTVLFFIPVILGYIFCTWFVGVIICIITLRLLKPSHSDLIMYFEHASYLPAIKMPP